MAVTTGSKTLQVSSEERTYQAVIKSAKNADGVIQVYREERTTLTDGSLISQRERPMVQRQASAILAETVVLPDGSIISAASIVAALPLFFDRWATEDAAKPPQDS